MEHGNAPPSAPAERGRQGGPILDAGRAALVVAHPGHELRVHGWLETVAPVTFVLTDGSGHSNASRLDSTTAVLAAAGARQGPVYGRFTDRALYAAMLSGNERLFIDLAGELAAAFIDARVDYVAGDAVEGYNPSHDLCRGLIDAAVSIATAQSGRKIANFEFPLMGRPDVCPPGLRHQAMWITLDDEALGRKLAAAQGYPELAEEVANTLAEVGAEPFRVECLRPANACIDLVAAEGRPRYERFGEQRVADQCYSRPIRHREHILPIEEALRVCASRPS